MRCIFALHAHKYAGLGWHIFPLAAGSKVPLANSAGLYDATINRAQIGAWCKQHPHANIGGHCGPESGIVAVDIDPRNGGTETVEKLAKQGKVFPETVESA